MKQKISLSFFALLLNFFSSNAQVQFWSDTFEDTGAPSSGIRTPENNGGTGGTPNTAYFKRTDGTDIELVTTSDGAYIGKQGNKFWAGEDHDAAFGAGAEEQQIDFTGINISGKSGLSFRGRFAAASSNGQWDNLAFANSHNDYIIVQYSIDGGTYTNLISFYSDNVTDKKFREDTDGNQIGDGGLLTKTFTEFTKSIAGTGTTMNLRLRVYSNNTNNEEWAIDDFRLFETILGVDDFEKSKVLKVYPNPSKGSFKILSQHDASITLYNQLGQNIKQFKVSQDIETIISNEGLSQGVYFLVGNTSDGKKFNEKIVIEK